MNEVTKQLADALRVILLTTKTKRYLRDNDPKALEQAIAALDAFAPNEIENAMDIAEGELLQLAENAFSYKISTDGVVIELASIFRKMRSAVRNQQSHHLQV
jgi:ATP/maltotriose-dependent transcriptional regulator MalT